MISDQIGRDLISCNIRSDPHDIKSGQIRTSSPGKKDLEEEEEKPSSTRRTPHPSYSREEEARETSSIIGLPLLNPSPSTIRPPPPRSEFQENGIGDHAKESPLPFEALVRLRLGEEFSVLVAAPQQPCTPKNNPASPPTSRRMVSSVGAALEMQSSCTPLPRTPPSTSSGSSKGSALGSHSPSVPPLQLEEQLP